jgi:hypothetical protein
VVEVTMHPGKPLTLKAATESPASSSKMAPAKAATDVAAAKSAPNMSATQSTTHVPATESPTHVAATESTTHVATTKSAATMSSGQGIRRNRHRAGQQSRSSHNTKITLHEYLQWFDQFTLIVHEHISGSAAGTIKLAFRKLNSILSEQVGKRSATYGSLCAT